LLAESAEAARAEHTLKQPREAIATPLDSADVESEGIGSRVAANAASLVTARLVSIGTVIATTPLLFGMLGARQFGLWSLLLGCIAVVGLSDLGLGSAQIREVARAATTGDRRRARTALALALLVYGLLALILLMSILVGWSAFASAFRLGGGAPQARDAALLLVAAFVLDLLAMPWRAGLEGNQRMRPIAATVAASAACEAVVGVTLVAAGAGLLGLGTAAVAASLLRAVILVLAGRRSLMGLRPSLCGSTAKELRSLLGYGVCIQGTNAAFAVNSQSDRLVLGAVFSPLIVAPFVLGNRLVTALRIVPGYIVAALFPAVSVLHAQGDRILVDRLYLRATRYLAVFACVSGAALIVTAGPLVRLWIGQPLPLAADTITFLCPAYALALVAGAAVAVTRAEGKPGRETRYAVLAAGLNGALTLPLLAAFGAKGVPLATGVASAIATAYFFWHFHRSSGRPLAPVVKLAWKPFAAAGLAVCLTWTAFGALPNGAGRLGAAAATGSRATAVLVFATLGLAGLRFFNGEDRALLRRALARIGAVAPAPLATTAGPGPSW
jgi:O-antigen/teichoic acid export membrane protein